MTAHALVCATAADGRDLDAAYPQLAAGMLAYLTGDWDVVREIADHRNAIAGSFRGQASFRPRPESATESTAAALTGTALTGTALTGTELTGTEPDGLDGRVLELTEHGELRFGAWHGPAGRSLLYYGCSDGSADVRFADDREFYRLDLRTGSCHAVHPCRADRYAVTVTWLSADSFTEVWQVTGPDKDYDLTSVYTRAGCGS